MDRGTEAVTVGAVPVQSEPVPHPSAGEGLQGAGAGAEAL